MRDVERSGPARSPNRGSRCNPQARLATTAALIEPHRRRQARRRMTYHAELAPRRRQLADRHAADPRAGARRGVERRLVLRGGRGRDPHQRLAGAAGERRARVSPAARRRSAGFRSASRCAALDASAELKDAQPPIALKLKEILVVAQVWDPKLLIAEFTGPLTASDPGQPPYATAIMDARAGERARHAASAGARLDRGRWAEARRRAPGNAAVRCKARRVSCARAVRLVAAAIRRSISR